MAADELLARPAATAIYDTDRVGIPFAPQVAAETDRNFISGAQRFRSQIVIAVGDPRIRVVADERVSTIVRAQSNLPPALVDVLYRAMHFVAPRFESIVPIVNSPFAITAINVFTRQERHTLAA